MTDFIQVSQGSGTNIATKYDTSNIHHQKALMEIMGATDPAPVSSTNPVPVYDQAVNSGGATPFHSRTLSSTATNIGSGQSRLYGFDLYNRNATTDAYVKFYNKDAASVNPASDLPFLGPYCVPAGGGISKSFVKGFEFTTKCSVRLVTGLADTDTVGVAANDVLFNAEFKE